MWYEENNCVDFFCFAINSIFKIYIPRILSANRFPNMINVLTTTSINKLPDIDLNNGIYLATVLQLEQLLGEFEIG